MVQASYQVLGAPREVTTAGGHQLDELARGLLHGNVVCFVQLSCLVKHGLRRNQVSVKQAAHNGVVFISDMNNPRL